MKKSLLYSLIGLMSLALAICDTYASQKGLAPLWKDFSALHALVDESLALQTLSALQAANSELHVLAKTVSLITAKPRGFATGEPEFGYGSRSGEEENKKRQNRATPSYKYLQTLSLKDQEESSYVYGKAPKKKHTEKNTHRGVRNEDGSPIIKCNKCKNHNCLSTTGVLSFKKGIKDCSVKDYTFNLPEGFIRCPEKGCEHVFKKANLRGQHKTHIRKFHPKLFEKGIRSFAP